MKNLQSFIFIIVCVSCICACDIEVKKENNATASSNTKIRNGIKIEDSGLHVQQAFLLRDDGTLISDSNKVQVGERIGLRLIVEGWKETNGLVNVGASEKVSTSDDQIILDEKNLFEKDFPNGIKPEDARYITLYVKIDEVNQLYDYYLVSFKLWDKATNKSFSGSYKFYI